MSTSSQIEWTEATWNPVTGCTKLSPGCKHCYAARFAKRLQAMGVEQYRNGFQLALQEKHLELPLRWKKPRLIFVNSMSDLFRKNVPTQYIQRVFDVMARAPQHTFQILTKRSERLRELSPHLLWTPNVWMGVSVESNRYVSRMDDLRNCGARIGFVSFEPLLDQIESPDLSGIHWAIAGGESGPGARPMQPQWARSLRDQCVREGVSFFFKQWGGVFKKRNGRELDGRTWDEIPPRSKLT